MITLNQMYSVLPSLTQGDLEQLKARCSFLMVTGATSGARMTNEMLFYSTFQDVMARMKLSAIPFGVFRKTGDYTRYKESITIIDKFIADTLEGMNRGKRIRMYRIFSLLVIEDLKSRGIEVTAATVARNLHRAPALVEQAFPGYVEAGLMHVLLRHAGGRGSTVAGLYETPI